MREFNGVDITAFCVDSAQCVQVVAGCGGRQRAARDLEWLLILPLVIPGRTVTRGEQEHRAGEQQPRCRISVSEWTAGHEKIKLGGRDLPRLRHREVVGNAEHKSL